VVVVVVVRRRRVVVVVVSAAPGSRESLASPEAGTGSWTSP
jgi:hypothetical protein